jgi:hypothetical protein
MKKQNLPVPVRKKGQAHPLWEEILRFSKNKYLLALILILIGLLGVVVPVIPGILLFLLAIALLRKGMMARIRRYFKTRADN